MNEFTSQDQGEEIIRETMPDPEEGLSIRAQVEARRQEEAELLRPASSGAAKDPITPDLIWRCLNGNELGDGILFILVHRGKFVFDATAGQWLVWAGHHWDRDQVGQALAAMEDVVARYQGEADALGRQIAAAADEGEVKRLQANQGRLRRRIERLRSTKGRQNVLHFASTGDHSLVITGDRLDAKPLLLACNNGVVDLETGQLLPGHPDDYLVKAAPFDFPTGPEIEFFLRTGEKSPCPTWEAFLVEIMAGRRHCAEYLQRLLGYSITGLVREHVAAVWYGRQGRNGKGTMVEVLQTVLGPLAGPIASEMLLDQGKARSSAGPSPDIMQLRGLRVAFANETDQGRRFSAARVKWLSGGDSLVGRNPHDREPTTFFPSHQLILATNYRPKAPPEDSAFWARLHLLEFDLSFVERPKAAHERPLDKKLKEKLLAEAPGILAWLVRGCLLWQRDGLNPPDEVLAATAEYRRSEDLLADFLEDKCDTEDGAIITAKSLYEAFKGWYSANVSEKVPSVKWFGDAMSRRFSKDLGGPGKTVRYLGLALRSTYDA